MAIFGLKSDWSEVGSGFEEQGGTLLPRIPRSTPGDHARLSIDNRLSQTFYGCLCALLTLE